MVVLDDPDFLDTAYLDLPDGSFGVYQVDVEDLKISLCMNLGVLNS